jgi:hypothetical protein
VPLIGIWACSCCGAIATAWLAMHFSMYVAESPLFPAFALTFPAWTSIPAWFSLYSKDVLHSSWMKLDQVL